MMLGHDIHQKPRTRDVQISHNITFDTMLLSPQLLLGLKSSGFYKPSPIQLHGIPLGKCGFDLLLEAKSGTGKTAVFTVIALEKIDLKKGLQVVILAPTREIAAQICDVIKHIGSHYKGLHVEVVMGGLPVQEDIAKFKRNVHIVVASPGRLRHLIQDKYIDTSFVRLLILDEADKLVEKSFQEDIKYIVSCLPKQKQVIMSSATYTETAKAFIKDYVQNAQHVCPDSNCVLVGVEQKISLVNYNSNIVKQTQNRFHEVLKIFSKIQFKQCLIFCNYQVRVSEVHKLLSRAKWPAEQLYGNQEQTDRLDALKTLQEYKCRILIATDLAARGIDASNIDLVINFEPPFEWQTYLHRIGRAGRYGSYGMAITILSEGTEARKFHTMLEPMKETINVTNLWCNNEIAINDYVLSNTNIPKSYENCEEFNTTKEIEKDFKELWRILTSEEEKITKQNEFESFENLCASFDEFNSYIETFDDLLQSFERSQSHTDIRINFKHIDMTRSQFKEIWNKHLNMILEKQTQHRNGDNDKIDKNNSKKNPGVEAYFNKKELEINVNTDSKYNNILLNNHENNNGYHDENFNVPIKNINKQELINDSISTYNQSHICRSASIDSNGDDAVKKALLDAGLPTEFGKKRSIRSEFHTKQNRYNRSHHLMASPENSNIKSFAQGDLKSKTSKNNCNSDKICEPDEYFNKYQEHANIFENRSDNFNHKTRSKSSKKINKPSKNVDYISENYAAWYRQLKFQTKQIELAIYIDELSKL